MRRRQLRALKEIIPETPDRHRVQVRTPNLGGGRVLLRPPPPVQLHSTVIEVVPSFAAGWWIRGQMLKLRGAVFLPLNVSSSVYPTACAA
jgi:hypothetical protein